MPPSTWKSVERRICRYLGSDRTPLSGSNSRHGTSSDCLHEKLYVEIKHGSAVPRSWEGMQKLFMDTEQKAIQENKRPLLVMHPKRAKNIGSYLTMFREQFSGERHLVIAPLATVMRLLNERTEQVNETRI